jgi:hypothetical protein
MAGPVNVPDTDFVAGAAGVALCVAVEVGVAEAVALAVALAVAEAVALACAVAFLVTTGFEVFFDVCVAAVCVATALDEVDDEADAIAPPLPIAAPPAMFIPPLELSCGGVIAMTAPSPPTVPPAINSARFISYPHFVQSLA